MSTLFNVTLESNVLTGTADSFDSAVTDGGDLSVKPAAAMGFGNYGLQCIINDANVIYGQKNQAPPASNTIRVRFYIDPNGLTMANDDSFGIHRLHSTAFTYLLQVNLRYRVATGYQLDFHRTNDGGWVGQDNVLITDAPHYVEYRIDRAATNISADGTLDIYVDGSLEASYNNIDNYDNFGAIDFLSLGAIVGIDAGTSGTLYLDELRANDDGSEIGASIRPDLQLLIDGVDHISELVHESLTVHQTNDGLNSVCEFDIRDAGVIQKDAWTVGVTRVEDGDVITGHTVFSSPKVEVSITDGATVYFAGVLSRVAVRPVGQILIGDYQQPEVQILACRCHDFNALLEESVIDTLEEYANQTDEAVIDDIFGKYVTGIDFATHVDGGAFTFKSISFENITVRQALDLIVARTGYVWYVDYSKKLHYSEAEANSPAWHLSDVPDDVNSFSYLDPVNREVDATNLVNRVFVVSSVGATWFTDAASIATYGDHRAIVRDERLSITESIAARGAAILAKFKDPITTYVIRTYKDGLRAGMHVRFVCAYLDIDDTFLISRLRIEFPIDGDPIYELTLGGLESSVGGAAHRYILDEIISPPPIPPSQLPLASRGWGHDLVFSSTDDDTVAWDAGTITTASGQTFAIAAGDTDDPGAMAAKTIVYLDTVISLTELQMTTDETAALGANRIMVAVCWPSGIATVDAGFQVFGATTEIATYLNATNVIADCITANEIYGNTLSVIAADMGTLTAGTINIVGAGGGRIILNNGGIGVYDAAAKLRIRLNASDGTFELTSAEAGNARIEIDNTEIVGYDGADVKQFYLSAADGKAYAGAGAVRMDKGGLYLVELGALDTGYLHFEDGGSDRAIIHGYDDATGNHLVLYAVKPALAADQGTIYLEAKDSTGAAGAKVQLSSKMTGTAGGVVIAAEGAMDFAVYKDYTKVFDDLKVVGGISLISTIINPVAGQIHFNSAQYALRRNGIHIEWYDGTSWVQLDNGP